MNDGDELMMSMTKKLAKTIDILNKFNSMNLEFCLELGRRRKPGYWMTANSTSFAVRLPLGRPHPDAHVFSFTHGMHTKRRTSSQ